MAEETKNLYLICGDEEFLKLEKKKELLKLYGAEDSLNYNEFSGKEIDIPEIRGLAETMPFMQEKRTVLLAETGFFKGAAPEEALELVKECPASTVLIFIENEADAGNKLYKLIKEKGKVIKLVKNESMSYKEAEADKGRIKERIIKLLEKEKRSISGRNLNNFLLLTGYDLFNINNELEKLIAYTRRPSGAGAVEITEEDIEAVCSKTVSDRVFDMLSAKLSGNSKKALMLYEEMLSIKTAPMKVLFMLEKQFNQVYMLKELLEKGLPESAIAEKMELQPWLLRKLREQSKNIRKADARRYLERSVELETAVKQGDMTDKMAVELILID